MKKLVAGATLAVFVAGLVRFFPDIVGHMKMRSM
jgi:hypothetical protein